MIYKCAAELIGRTPLIALNNIKEKFSLKANLIAKAELFNPAGSIKDRAALEMIKDAEQSGKLKKGTTIIETTSGNTGIGLASVGCAMGYKVIIIMPDTMSVERRMLMKAYGAEVVLSDGALGMSGTIAKAEEIQKEMPDSIIMGQFTNPANPEAHYKTTGPEIWEDTEGAIDILVCGVGTGGTITGTGKYLKEKKSDINIVAVEPDASPLLSGGTAAPHKLQGIGANFIPEILDRSIIDEIIPISADDAYECGRLMGQLEGLLVGISSGAALSAAIELAKRSENEGKNIVVILPDTGERYLSTEGYLG